MSSSARRRIGPETWSGRAGGREAGFWLRADRVEQDNQALRQERDGLIERIKERIAGIYRELQAVDPLLGLLEQAATRASAEVSRVAANKAGDNHFPALAQQPRRGLCLFLEIAQQRAISKEINLTCSQLH